MPKFEPQEYRSIEEYRSAIEGFHGFCGLLLFGFAKHECSKKDVIIHNFIARTDTMVRGIMQLWDLSDFQDCYVLHRCLLDRLFHLIHLGEQDEFELFEEWSFFQQYKAQNRVRSDLKFQGALKTQLFTPTDEQKERFKKLSESPPQWKRPEAEGVAKRRGLDFLYKYGYDLGSTHVHPMANDGQQDFYTITGLQPAPEFPDNRVVLSNSLLAGTLIVQEAMNTGGFRWRRMVYDFLDHLMEFVENGSLRYEETLVKILQYSRKVNLCEPRS